MKTITYRYYRQEFNYLQERVDALCAGLDFHVQVCEINHPMDPIRLGVNWSAIGAVPADQLTLAALPSRRPLIWPPTSATPDICSNTKEAFL